MNEKMSDALTAVLCVFILCVMFLTGYSTGMRLTEDNYKTNCVAKYSDMPNSKVHDYCKELLKFNKE